MKIQMAAQSQMGPGQEQKGLTQGVGPMTEKEVYKEIRSASAETVIKDVKRRGVDFELTPSIEKKLRKAQATDQIVEAVRRAGPTARANTLKWMLGPVEGGPAKLPPEQVQALDAIKGESDPQKAIALVARFSQKYPDSALLSYADCLVADIYQQRDEVEKVIEYTGKGLKLKPDCLACLLMRARMLPQPEYLNNHVAEHSEILREAESDCKRALEVIAQMPRQPEEADADYQEFRASSTAQVHGALGMVHLELALDSLVPDKTELAKAEEEFKTAVSITDRPDAQDYLRLGEAYGMDGKLDDAIQAFSKAGQLGQGTMMKTLADQQVEEMKKRKTQAMAGPSPK
jgi:tetratricopeptide (TPR) repeat protein